MSDSISLSAYWEMLDRHDWTYEHSDDHSVWARGRAEGAKLEAIAKQSPEHLALMRAFQKHHFNGVPWGTIQPPKPEKPKNG